MTEFVPHHARVTAEGDALPSDSEEEEEEEKEDATEDELIDAKIASATRIGLKDSLFDAHRSRSFAQNLRYMTRTFGFFIPELEFLRDVKGLIQYLGDKVSVGNTCLFCQRSFGSLEATQSHMVRPDRRHPHAPHSHLARRIALYDLMGGQRGRVRRIL